MCLKVVDTRRNGSSRARQYHYFTVHLAKSRVARIFAGGQLSPVLTDAARPSRLPEKACGGKSSSLASFFSARSFSPPFFRCRGPAVGDLAPFRETVRIQLTAWTAIANRFHVHTKVVGHTSEGSQRFPFVCSQNRLGNRAPKTHPDLPPRDAR
jgi:hypothetical protein